MKTDIIFSLLTTVALITCPSFSASVDYSTSAVLFVDVQGLWTKNSIAGDFPDLGTNLNKLLEFARNNDILVVHLYADYNEQETKWFRLPRDIAVMYANNLPDTDLIEPIEGEAIFNKSTFDGFYNTTLDEFLSSKGIDTIYAAGVATSVCVTNTVHGAFIRGYDTFYVKNACGDDSQQLHDLVIQRYFRTRVVNIADEGLIADDSNKRADDEIYEDETSSNQSTDNQSEMRRIIPIMCGILVIIVIAFVCRYKKAPKKTVHVGIDSGNDDKESDDDEIAMQKVETLETHTNHKSKKMCLKTPLNQ